MGVGKNPMTKSIKNIRKQFHDQGIFYTPPELAEKVKSFVDFTPRDVYDPTCGAGGLLKVFPDDIPKFGQEKDPEGYEMAKAEVVNATIELGDTLENPAFMGRKFHCIVGNPPFSVKWSPDKVRSDDDGRFADAPCLPPQSKADYAFILHILHYLVDDGMAVILEFPGILYRGQREGKIRQWLVEQNVIDYIEEIPGNTFEDTSVATVMLTIRKNRIVDAPIHMKTEHGEFEVSLDEIREAGYTLTPSSFDPYEEPKEVIDPIALRDEARQDIKKRLIAQINFEIAVCKLEQWDYVEFLEDLISTIKEFI